MASGQFQSFTTGGKRVLVTPDYLTFDPRFLLPQSSSIYIENQTNERLTYRVYGSHPDFYAVSEPAGPVRDFTKITITVRLLSKPTTQDSQDFRVDVLNARTKQQLTTKRIEVRFAERSEESFLSASTARQEKSSRRASGPVEHPDVSGADSEAASSSKTPSGSGSTAYGSSQVKSAKKIQETEHVWFKRNWYLLLCMSICIAVLLAPLGNKCTASDDEDAETVDEATVENSESTFDTLFPPDLMDSKWWQILSRVLERSVATFVTALHVTCEFKCFAAFFLGAFVTKCLLEATPVGSNA